MVVSELRLKKFRNFHVYCSEFRPGINLIYGKNGQGKTNIIESIYYSINLKSFRTKKIDPLIQYSEQESWIQTRFEKQKVQHNLSILLNKKGKKVTLDQKKVVASSDFVREYFIVLFSPDQIAEFKEFPQTRRNFFDRFFSFLYPEYLLKIKDYYKLIQNKNKLLREKRNNEVIVWNRLISKILPKIIEIRQKSIYFFNKKIQELFFFLTRKKKEFLIDYKNNLDRVTLNEHEIFEFLSFNLEREASAGYALIGPHRDDYRFQLDGKTEKSAFSQGEYRTAYLAMELALSDIVSSEKMYYPILLLDDVFSELDDDVCERLFTRLDNSSNQIFVTSTRVPEGLSKKGTHFYLENGELQCVSE